MTNNKNSVKACDLRRLLTRSAIGGASIGIGLKMMVVYGSETNLPWIHVNTFDGLAIFLAGAYLLWLGVVEWWKKFE